MKLLRKYAWLMLVLILAGGDITLLLANDSAASVASGGIQLRREANISMEKERLTISETKVTVEYEFLNQTDKDITTVVAFPIPPYDVGVTDAEGQRNFNDFHVWVEGKELKYKTEVHARLGDKDYSGLLNSLGIDIASFGHYDDEGETPTSQLTKLSKGQLDRLIRLGLISGPDDSFPLMPQWDAVKTYYWTQTFPAHKLLHIRHEYTPSFGFEEISPGELLDPKKPHIADERDQIGTGCVDPSLAKLLRDRDKADEDLMMVWVDYILTTANSWKTPIKDFTLIIDKRRNRKVFPVPRFGMQYVSLCWDGPIKKLDPNHFILHKTNFVPSKELHVVFFILPLAAR